MMVCKAEQLAALFRGTLFVLERMDRQNVVIQIWVLDRHFSKMNEMSLSLQGKPLIVFVARDKIQAFR